MNPHEDQFLEEMLGLFALEAQEWVRQICAALLELDKGPTPDRAPKLFDTILRGITNLGGSAATVQLPVIEKLAFALVPLVHVIQRHGGTGSAEQFEALHEALRAISSSIHGLAETRTVILMDADPILQRIAAVVGPPSGQADSQIRTSSAAKGSLPEPAPAPVAQPLAEVTAECDARPPSAPAPPLSLVKPQAASEPVLAPTGAEAPIVHEPAAPPPAPEPAPPPSVLEILANLRQVRAQSLAQTRNLVEVVMRKAQAGSDPGGAGVEATTILTILHELEALDERFLADVQERMPRIHRVLSGLKPGNSENGERDWNPESVLQDVQQLLEKARAVEASAVAAFFQGLHTFLSVATQGRVKLTPQRFEAVESRLSRVLAMIQEWIEIGRAERATIEQVLALS